MKIKESTLSSQIRALAPNERVAVSSKYGDVMIGGVYRSPDGDWAFYSEDATIGVDNAEEAEEGLRIIMEMRRFAGPFDIWREPVS